MELNYFGEKKRKILLFLTLPTPNGRLHLGHIGGPFLKLDIIKRFNNQIGNNAYIYGGTDSYDSYVLLKAHQTNQTPQEVSNYYHKAIEEDINKMSIEMDFFLNPIDGSVNDFYQKTIQKLNNKLLLTNKIHEINEKYPYINEIGFIPPSYITGNCNYCLAIVHSFICENCGLTLEPEKILNKSCKITNNNIQEKKTKVTKLLIDKKALISSLKKIKLPLSLNKTVNDFISVSKYLRLTIPISWGVPANNNNVYYTYGNFFTYLYTLSEFFKKKYHLPLNPFDKDSDIETVATFGFDNIISFAVNISNQSNQLDYKNLTYYLPNYFITLNGEKFSTSRNHAIWVKKIASDLSIDILRLYLIKTNADVNQNDFNLNDFIIFYNKIAFIINNKLAKKFDVCSENNEKSRITQLFKIIINNNYKHAMPENYCGYNLYQNISTWLDFEVCNPDSSHLWLKGFSIIAYSIMPTLSLFIWHELEEDGIPTPNRFLIKNKLENNEIRFTPLRKITVEDMI